ncbi:MAG: lipid II flippase MurJ [Bifidobacterium sp.]|nr:lipid II flippase MurJ [Bifidobacterium sp.]
MSESSPSVGRNSLIMASGTAASRITGQIRTILLAAAIGTTGLAANAYQAGSMIPQVIYTLVSGGIFNAVLVPHIVRSMKAKDAEDQLNKLVTLSVSLLLGVTVLMAVLAPLITRLYVAGSSELVSLTYAFTLWCTPQIFFYGLYTLLGQILAVKEKFGAYAWSSVGANVISCAGFIVFIAMFGDLSNSTLAEWDTTKIALTAGMWTLGVAFQGLILFIPIWRSGIRLRPKFGIHGIGLRTMGSIAGWSLGIVVMDQIANIIITRVLTSAPMRAAEQGAGAIVAGNATYQNAYTIYLLPYSLIAVSVATAIFPRISASIAAHDMHEAREALSSSLRNVGVLMCFFTAVFFAIPLLMVQSLLPSVGTQQAMLIANTLAFLSLGLPLSSAYLIIQRTFYAFEDGRSPFTFMVVLYGLELVFVVVGMQFVPPTRWSDLVGGSLSLAYIISFIPLVVMLRRRFEGSLDGRRIAVTYVKAGVAAVVCALVGIVMYNPLAAWVSPWTGPHSGWLVRWLAHILVACIIGLVMLAVYIGVLWLLKTEELVGMVSTVKARLSRGNAATPAAAGGEADGAVEAPEGAATLPPSFPPAAGEYDDDATRIVPIISDVTPGVPADELEEPIAEVPSALEEQPVVDAAERAAVPQPALPERPATPSVGRQGNLPNATTGADRMATDTARGTGPAPHDFSNGSGELMRPHLGDTVLNRYTLVSPLREEAGLQAWKANDRVLSRDCQLFIVNNKAVLRSTNAIAGTLAASRDPRFTQVIQLQHDGAIAVVLTAIDAGQSLTEYMAADTAAPLGHEAMRTIIADAGQAVRALQKEHLTHHAISTDTIRLTKSGVQLADAPVSEALADTSDGQPGDNDERRAVRQLAAVLYCMLTRTASSMRPRFSLDDLPADTPGEFRTVVKRGLELPEGGKPTVPLLTIAEMELLLGTAKPLHALDRSEVRITRVEGSCSIVRAMVQPALPGDILPISDTLVSSQTLPALQFSAPVPEPVYEDEDEDEEEKKDADKTEAADNKSFKALWNRSKAIMAEGGAAGEPDLQPEDATEMFTAFDPNHVSEPPVQSGRMTVPMDVSGIRHGVPAAAGAGAAGAGLDDATVIGEQTGDTGEIVDDTAGASSTGRIPVIGDDGHVVPPGAESQRALERERQDIEATYAMGAPALPPSFAPQESTAKRPNELRAFDDGGKKSVSRVRRVALIVCIVAVVAALGVAIHSIATTGSIFGFTTQQDTTYWPSMNLDNVPFGTRKGSEVDTPTHTPEPSKTATPSPSETKKENTTPYTIASQNFLDRPDGQQGYGYYMHLAQKEDVSKVVITIRSSGGQGYIRVNTTGNPTQGEQVAQFTFAEGGTTTVKLDKSVETQDVMLWVPLDSLPGNQLYIQSVQVY